MTVKEIIGECLLRMGRKNFLESETLSDEEKSVKETLIASLNSAYFEIATEHMPYIKDEKVRAKDKTIFNRDLKSPMLYPISLNREGAKAKFKIFHDRLETDFDGEAVLRYAYPPEKLSETDSIEDSRMTLELLVAGTLSKYYFAMRAFDLASSYDSDFRYKLAYLKYKGKTMTLGRG